jgi:hypothetical protein
MGYGHAERNLALIRQLEAETMELLDTLNRHDPEQTAWLQEVISQKGRRLSDADPRRQRRLGSSMRYGGCYAWALLPADRDGRLDALPG